MLTSLLFEGFQYQVTANKAGETSSQTAPARGRIEHSSVSSDEKTECVYER
jgi:hypothetical protein